MYLIVKTIQLSCFKVSKIVPNNTFSHLKQGFSTSECFKTIDGHASRNVWRNNKMWWMVYTLLGQQFLAQVPLNMKVLTLSQMHI